MPSSEGGSCWLQHLKKAGNERKMRLKKARKASLEKNCSGNCGYRVKHRCRCICVTKLIPETFDSFKSCRGEGSSVNSVCQARTTTSSILDANRYLICSISGLELWRTRQALTSRGDERCVKISPIEAMLRGLRKQGAEMVQRLWRAVGTVEDWPLRQRSGQAVHAHAPSAPLRLPLPGNTCYPYFLGDR